MPFMSLIEFINLIILAVAIGYIFTGFIRTPEHMRLTKGRLRFNLKDFKFALLVVAPGVVLHELAHKFVAMAYGLNAAFHVWWPGLGLAIFLKLIASPFLIIAPGFVLIEGQASNIAIILTAAAGPATNLIIWLVAAFILARAKHLSHFQAVALVLTKRINMLLFIFNMIPIPPLDGSKVIFGLGSLIASSF